MFLFNRGTESNYRNKIIRKDFYLGTTYLLIKRCSLQHIVDWVRVFRHDIHFLSRKHNLLLRVIMFSVFRHWADKLKAEILHFLRTSEIVSWLVGWAKKWSKDLLSLICIYLLSFREVLSLDSKWIVISESK